MAFKQVHFGVHPFLQRLEKNEPLRHVLPFASYLTFWVMTFQDVLRLNESKVEDPSIQLMSRHHRAEEAGHDRWFLADLLKIEGANPDLRDVFSSPHTATRDAAYTLMAEVFTARTDDERIVLLLALESTSHVFFEKIASYFERQGVSAALQYFARHHIDAEEQHEIFEVKMMDKLQRRALEPSVRQRCLDLVDRCFAAFDLLFDGLEERLDHVVSRLARPSGLRQALSREERLLQVETELLRAG
ncbi:MAG TPA: iron-containing redox enzyme family protein [Myxococcales bacterium]|nr:iron-containing redox enzyme family protein [Myxococcales bacterium]